MQKNKPLLPEKELARYEVKIPIPFTSLSEITPFIMLDPAGFSKEYPDRIVNSLYYDSHNLDSYADNLSGGGCRTKFRLRWYNESTKCTKLTAEAKIKRNHVGWKEKADITLPKPLDKISFTQLSKSISEQISNETLLSVFKENISPTMLISYHRQYYCSNNTKIRITVDSKIQYYNQHFSQTLAHSIVPVTCDNIILECKFLVCDKEEANRVIRSLPFRPWKNSKYVIGVKMTNYF